MTRRPRRSAPQKERPVPTARLAWLAVLGVPLSLLGLFGVARLGFALTYDFLLLAAAFVDWIAAGDPSRFQVRRELPGRWIQGRSDRVALGVASVRPSDARPEAGTLARPQANPHAGGVPLPAGRAVGSLAPPPAAKRRRVGRLVLRDVPPASFRVPSSLFETEVDPRRAITLSYEAVPQERGDHVFGPVAARAHGPFRLVERQATLLAPGETVRVYPDLVSLSAREASLSRPGAWIAGAHRGRTPGEGREFHQLRDYSAGDDARLVDWKAFARHGRPAVREYRAERNQRVLVLIDSGRLMTSRVGDRLRFDWAVQAAGRLARVALAFGDSVGIAFFSRAVKAQLPAGRGPGQLARAAELLSLARHDLDDPDLGRALRTLLRGGCRRTLVVVFTELADPRAAEAAVAHIGALAPRHLGLAVTLADADLEAARDAVPADAEAAFERVAADEMWQDYRRTEQSLIARGALVARARAGALAAETVERYMEIKRTGRL